MDRSVDAEDEKKNSDYYCSDAEGETVYPLFPFIKGITGLLFILFKNFFLVHPTRPPRDSGLFSKIYLVYLCYHILYQLSSILDIFSFKLGITVF